MRDDLAALTAAKIIPVGVNHGDAASHLAFIEEFDFPFDLLVDEGMQVASAYDALKPEGTGIQRTVVVVGLDGRIVFREMGAPSPAVVIAAVSGGTDEMTPA